VFKSCDDLRLTMSDKWTVWLLKDDGASGRGPHALLTILRLTMIIDEWVVGC
jgi:hypothetical protein